MGIEPVSTGWCDARAGQKVVLSRENGEHYSGVVDDRSEDGAFLWVLTTGNGRKLFHVGDGFRVDYAD